MVLREAVHHRSELRVSHHLVHFLLGGLLARGALRACLLAFLFGGFAQKFRPGHCQLRQFTDVIMPGIVLGRRMAKREPNRVSMGPNRVSMGASRVSMGANRVIIMFQ